MKIRLFYQVRVCSLMSVYGVFAGRGKPQVCRDLQFGSRPISDGIPTNLLVGH